MRKIRVVGLHPWIKNKEGIIKQLHINNTQICENIVWDEENPEYVIATEHIYWNYEMFEKFRNYYKKHGAIYIFFGGEAVAPDLNIFDYAIVFNKKLKYMNRIASIPTIYFFENTCGNNIFENTLNYSSALQLLNEKKFCNFLYSNPHAHPMRDGLFWEISKKYKKVESIGKHLNNTGARSSRYENNWADLSVQLKSNYKFSISAENATYEGYTSEKLLTSFLAHSVPIYWGNPHVADEFNSEAFINCHDFNSLEEVVDKIKEIDENDKLWAEMVSQPWLTEEQRDAVENEMKQYQNFLYDIFSKDIDEIQKRPEGTFKDVYCKWFFRKFKPKKNLIRYCAAKIKKLLFA